jgi:7-cyano-7-deazaguanine reductase
LRPVACQTKTPAKTAAKTAPTLRGGGETIKLGRRMTTQPSKSLETFANPKPERDYLIRFECPEFTCLCPKTGQPDFATIRVEYVADALCVELKSWKLYLWSYRDEGAFHEAVTNRILDDLVAATRPRRARVEAEFKVRGGITTTIVATHEK